MTSTPRNATDLLARRVAEAPDHVAFEVRAADGSWRRITTREFDDDVRALAKGLIAAGLARGRHPRPHAVPARRPPHRGEPDDGEHAHPPCPSS